MKGITLLVDAFGMKLVCFSEGFVTKQFDYFVDCNGHKDQGNPAKYTIVVGNNLTLDEIKCRMLDAPGRLHTVL